MTSSSIFHFFARLMERRGYFVQDNDLEDFIFPAYMIAAKSDGGFPDFVLTTNRDDKLVGGEFVELKDADGYRISPFNSTIPTATKLVSSLSMVMQKQLVVVGEDLDFLPERDVFYLIRGIKPSTSSPLAKTILVGGAFFETMPPNEVLAAAFDQVAAASMSGDMEVSELTKRFDVRQANFAGTRQVEGASISVRFRVMTQAAPAANLVVRQSVPDDQRQHTYHAGSRTSFDERYAVEQGLSVGTRLLAPSENAPHTSTLHKPTTKSTQP